MQSLQSSKNELRKAISAAESIFPMFSWNPQFREACALVHTDKQHAIEAMSGILQHSVASQRAYLARIPSGGYHACLHPECATQCTHRYNVTGERCACGTPHCR